MTVFRLVDNDLFTPDTAATPAERPALRGSRCGDCSTVVFPVQTTCPRCSGETMGDHTLPGEGALWAFTVQGFEPKSPYRGGARYKPYGVGYIDLGDVLVESILTESDPDKLMVGDRYTIRLIPSFTDDDGTEVLTYAFGPVETQSAGEQA